MANDLAFHIGEKRLATLAWREFFHVVRAEVIEKGLPVGSGDSDARPVLQFHETAVALEGGVFEQMFWDKSHRVLIRPATGHEAAILGGFPFNTHYRMLRIFQHDITFIAAGQTGQLVEIGNGR